MHGWCDCISLWFSYLFVFVYVCHGERKRKVTRRWSNGRWSNGSDSSLPRMRSGFDSPTAHVLLWIHD